MLLRLEQSHMPVSRSDSDRLCHGHISLLVHPKTLILDRLELPKDWLKNLANTFSAAAQKKGRLRPANLCRSWQVPLDKLVNLTSLTSWLVNLASCPSSNHLTSFIVKSSYQHKCRTLDLRVVLFHEMVNKTFSNWTWVRGNALRWGWVFLKRTQILSPVYQTFHRIRCCGNETIRR